jgi:hypothetical protein
MSSRNTSTGAVLEDTVLPVLRRNGYTFATQQVIGLSLSGRRHRADIMVDLTPTTKTIVSVKWQQVSGSAEEKVPFEIIKLIHAIKTSRGAVPYAYLVLAGPGWSSLKQFYLAQGLRPYITEYDLVKVTSLDDFMARTNRRQL